jgi:hypothetical protein
VDRFLAAVVLSVWAIAFSAAGAVAKCPQGTVFSAYKGHGICAYVGQGSKAAINCFVAKGDCPSGTTREHSNNDKKRDYCCPRTTAQLNCNWTGTAPFCGGGCGPGTFIREVRTEGCITGQKVECCQYLQ